jgi:hypothetical protein
MGKSHAALTHLWPSLFVLAIITGLILFVWYPYPFLQFKDTGKFSLMLVLSAAFIGPAMTWLFYRKGKSKRALAFDLVVILLIQTAARYCACPATGNTAQCPTRITAGNR